MAASLQGKTPIATGGTGIGAQVAAKRGANVSIDLAGVPPLLTGEGRYHLYFTE